jgi:protoporphyrinogen oxidase
LKIGIIGAGIAGLSTAYFLRSEFNDISIHEAAGVTGGLARSFKWHGFDCDLAPHRLYTNDGALLAELLALVPCSQVRRRSRIYIQGRWIQDPVNAVEMMLKFLPFRSAKLLWTYLFHTKLPDSNFENLVLSKFGDGLNTMFFKPYSEKLFGIPASQISASWGHRKLRVGGLKDMVRRDSRLYFRHFYYPKRDGYGAICERLHRDVAPFVRLNSRLTSITKIDSTGRYRCEFEERGHSRVDEFDCLVSSLPISYVSSLMGLETSLRFRSAKLTYLLVNKPRVSDNHWFYFADGHYIINRVAEPKNFAVGPVPVDKTVLCCEVTEVDRWSLDRVVGELESAGLLNRADVIDSKVIDIRNAYPIYDLSHDTQMARVEEFFSTHPNIFHVGRHAQFAHKDVDEIFDEAKHVAGRVVQQHRERTGQKATSRASDSIPLETNLLAPVPGSVAVAAEM